MRKLILISVISVFLVSPALGDFSPGDTFTWQGNTLTAVGRVDLDAIPLNSNGGAFSVNLLEGTFGPAYAGITGPASDVFTTFCIESDTSASYNGRYWASVDPVAYSGSVGSAGDPISDITEQIYKQWLDGSLTAAGYSQYQISRAIWYAEGEVGGSANGVYQLAAAALPGYGTGYTGMPTGSSSLVYALNLWTITGDDASGYEATDVQSQLILVPVPAATILGLLGLTVAGIKLRKSAVV